MGTRTFSFREEIYYAAWGLDVGRRFPGFEDVEDVEAMGILRRVMNGSGGSLPDPGARGPFASKSSMGFPSGRPGLENIRLHRRIRFRGLPSALRAVDLRDLAGPEIVPSTWIAVIVSSDDGSAYPQARLEVQTPHGRHVVDMAGRRGTWRDEDIPLNSQSSVRAVLEFGEPATPHPEAEKADFEHRLSPTLGDTVEVEGLKATAVHHLVIVRPRIWRPETCLFPTEPGSALSVPGPWTEGEHPWQPLLAILHKTHGDTNLELIVVGHQGSEDAEKRPGLVEARARAYMAMVRNDEAVWVQIATDFGTPRDIEAYLDYLATTGGWPCSVSSDRDGPEDGAKHAVSAFQDEFNRRFDADILVDGICGEQTLIAIFRVLQDELDHWLEKHALQRSDLDQLSVEAIDATGFELSHGVLRRPARRAPGIDLLVLERDARAGKPITPDLLYASPIPLLEELPVPPEPGGWQLGTLTIVVDQSPAEVRMMESFCLRANDGSYEKTLSIPDDAIDDGLSVLRFEEVPVNACYTLELQQGDGPWEAIIENASYSDLHEMTQNVPEAEEPSQNV